MNRGRSQSRRSLDYDYNYDHSYGYSHGHGHHPDYDYGHSHRSPSRFSSRSRSPSPRALRSRSAARTAPSSHHLARDHHRLEQHKDKQSHGLLRTSAGLVAGFGLAALAVHKLVPDHHHHRHHHKDCSDHHRRRSTSTDQHRQAVKEQLRRRGDAILARNRPDADAAAPAVYPRTTVHRRGNELIYEDVVPARDVGGGPRVHKAMLAEGYERRSMHRGRSADDHLDGRHHPRWDDHLVEPGYVAGGPRR